MSSEPPIACTLTAEQLQERRNTLLRNLKLAVQEVQEREHGYAWRFPARSFDQLTHVMDLERQCCAFLQFTLTVTPGDGPLWLEVTGPVGAKDLQRVEDALRATGVNRLIAGTEQNGETGQAPS